MYFLTKSFMHLTWHQFEARHKIAISCMFDQPELELNANEYTYELTVGSFLMYMFGWRKVFHYNYFLNMKKY